MNKKSISATILILFMSLFFAVVGSSFYYFEYYGKRTLVESVGVVADGVSVYTDKELTKPATKLKLSDMEIGLKPATGEVDAETQVPSTITDQGTSEGYYSTVFVKTQGNFRVQLSNIKIDSDHDELLIKEERKNIFVSVKDLKNSVKTLEEDGVEICRYSDVKEVVEITFLIWLGSFASDELEGAKISFDIKFVSF